MDYDIDEPSLYSALAADLRRPLPGLSRTAALGKRLLERVRQSAAAHREYTTVRHEDGAWLEAADDVQRRVLRSDGHTRVEIIRLKPGAALPWPDSTEAQEILLLEGRLETPGGHSSPTGISGANGYCVVSRSPDTGPLIATTDTTLYVRQLCVPPQELPPLEAHWWALACAAPTWIDPSRKRWLVKGEGVDVLPLRGDGDVVSMLVRFAAGASVPDHGHALDEDCLVLQGEMFLGDILLRAGDYQLAPAGGSHFGEMSDVGVLFFFHGAVDPVLRGDPKLR